MYPDKMHHIQKCKLSLKEKKKKVKDRETFLIH